MRPPYIPGACCKPCRHNVRADIIRQARRKQQLCTFKRWAQLSRCAARDREQHVLHGENNNSAHSNGGLSSAGVQRETAARTDRTSCHPPESQETLQLDKEPQSESLLHPSAFGGTGSSLSRLARTGALVCCPLQPHPQSRNVTLFTETS